MGGDNDRGIGYKLYDTAVVWEFARAVFNSRERRLILRKVEEYLRNRNDSDVFDCGFAALGNSAFLDNLGHTLLTCRFVYAHAVITHALHPRLQVRRAERIFIFDLRSGSIVLADSFEGNQPLRFATHLHCSGSVKELGGGRYRLTGGQANLMAGTKGGSKGLSDDERGEMFASVLQSGIGVPPVLGMSTQRQDAGPALGRDRQDAYPTFRVVIEEPPWIPAYIYGLNATGQEDLSEGQFPRYRRWRLEAAQPATSSAFLFARARSRRAGARLATRPVQASAASSPVYLGLVSAGWAVRPTVCHPE